MKHDSNNNNNNNRKADKYRLECGETGTLKHLLGKTVCQFLKMLITELSYNPTTPLLDI